MTEMVGPALITRRRLILRDLLAFLSLITITVVLFAVTLLLFRSFTARRADLAKGWSDRGHAALQAGQSTQAVSAYRAALTYAPGEKSYERMLAQALSEAGRTEESYNYFTELWEIHPGDGSINLQLARLSVKKGDVQEAINFYRASMYGTWPGDGVERRREVRLELARYFIAQHRSASARAELLIAGEDSSDTLDTDQSLAQLLEQAGAPADAVSYYQKALAREPRNASVLTHTGKLLYALGDYARAYQLLERAARENPESAIDPVLLSNSRRILQLLPSGTLSQHEQVLHILTMRRIASQRLASCSAELESKSAMPEAMKILQNRWANNTAIAGPAILSRSVDQQDAIVQLVYETELAASRTTCSPAIGDDALLLMLAKSALSKEAGHP